MVAIAPHPGARPEGEPAAIRAYAAEVRSVAAGLLARGGVRIDGWESPAASAAAEQARSVTSVVSDVRADLVSAAADVDRAASELADELKVWREELERHEETVRQDRQERQDKLEAAQTAALRRLAVGRAG